MDVYCHTNKINGLRYVGYTTGKMKKRWKDHIYAARNGSNQFFHQAIREFGPENFDNEVICEIDDVKNAKVLERFYIEMLNTWGPLGYNMTKGGNGSGYRIFSDLHRKRLSIASTGKIQSAEQKQKTSQREKGNSRRKGKLLNLEQKIQQRAARLAFLASEKGKAATAKMALTLTGRHLSNDHKEKISRKIKGKKRSLHTVQKMRESQQRRRMKEKETS